MKMAVFTITGSLNLQLLKFWLFNFSNFQTIFQFFFQVSKQTLKVLIKFYRFTYIYDLKFLDNETTILFLKIARKTVFLLKFCRMREILKPQFCWYSWNVLLWVILMEMKVSQVACFQITSCWICSSIFWISHL